jgi:adenosine deaminase CECR1
MVGSQLMAVHGWKQLIEWSIEYSCLTKGEQIIAKKMFEEQWEKFCKWIIEEYDEFASGIKF